MTLHRPDLGRSHVQEKGDQEEQEQKSHHLRGQRLQQTDTLTGAADCGFSARPRPYVNSTAESDALWEM